MTILSTTEQSKRRRWAREARPPRPDVRIVGEVPLAVLEIYEATALLTRRENHSWTSYPVAFNALAQTFANVPVSTGLLPPGALAAGHVYGRPYCVVYVPARRATLRMATADFTIPLPPLVFGGCGDNYRIFALSETAYPTAADTPLKVAPLPNCYSDGRICWGSSDARPVAEPNSLLMVLDLFLSGSLFNLHVADGKSRGFPDSIVALWETLREADSYPLDDLVDAKHSLAEVLGGQLWGASISRGLVGRRLVPAAATWDPDVPGDEDLEDDEDEEDD